MQIQGAGEARKHPHAAVAEYSRSLHAVCRVSPGRGPTGHPPDQGHKRPSRDRFQWVSIPPEDLSRRVVVPLLGVRGTSLAATLPARAL